MSIDFVRPEVDELRPRISVIGVGGAGGNAIANMMTRRRPGGRLHRRQHRCAGAQFLDRRPPHPARAQDHPGSRRRIAARNRPRGRRRDARRDRAGAGRRAHVLHRRRHGRRHRHRRRSGHRQGRPRQGHPDRRRGDQAVRVRRRAPRPRRPKPASHELQQHVDTLDRHSQPEPVPPRQFGNDLQGSVRDGRRGAPAGRPRDHRPDGHARPHQPRLRRRPLGDERDGQGDDGHRRGRGRQPRHRSRREGHLQPAARRRFACRAPRA